MKTLNTCDVCGGSLHPVYNIPDRFWCPTCKKYYSLSSYGWTEVRL